MPLDHVNGLSNEIKVDFVCSNANIEVSIFRFYFIIFEHRTRYPRYTLLEVMMMIMIIIIVVIMIILKIMVIEFLEFNVHKKYLREKLPNVWKIKL